MSDMIERATDRFRVTGYSDGWWCIVDGTKFLGEAERQANWPMRVQDVSPFSDRNQAQRFADELNRNARLGLERGGESQESERGEG